MAAVLAHVEGEPDPTPRDGGLGRPPLRDPLPLDAPTALPDAHTLALFVADRDARTAGVEALSALPVPDQADAQAHHLIHLASLWSVGGVRGAAAHILAGRANALSTELARRRRTGGHNVLDAAALVIASLTWPALPHARSRLGRAQVQLGRELTELARTGAGALWPSELAEIVWSALLAEAWLRETGPGLPAHATGAAASLASHLVSVLGPLSHMPGASQRNLLPLGACPLPHTIARLLHRWGHAAGPVPDDEDAAVGTLVGGSSRIAAPEPEELPDKRWRLRCWRGMDVAVTWRSLRRTPSRLWFAPRLGALRWHWGDLLVLGVDSTRGSLSQARVDGQRVSLAANEAVAIRLEQGRATIDLTPGDPLQLQLDPRWEVRPEADGLDGAVAGARLQLRGDASVRWRPAGHGSVTVSGEGRVRIELR